MRNNFALILVGIILLGMAACSTYNSSNPSSRKDTVAENSNMNSSNPSESLVTSNSVTEEEIEENNNLPNQVEKETTVDVEGNKVTLKPDGSKEIKMKDGKITEVKPDGSIKEPALTSSASSKITVKVTEKPTARPTMKPTTKPTINPTTQPTAKPTLTPIAKPTVNPTPKPTKKPIPAELKPYMPPFDKAIIKRDAIDYMMSNYPKAIYDNSLTLEGVGYFPPICTYDWHFEMQTYEDQINSAAVLRQYICDDCDYLAADYMGGEPFYFNVILQDYDSDNIRIYIVYS